MRGATVGWIYALNICCCRSCPSSVTGPLAHILKKRLKVAGYEPSDGINTIGKDDLSFLLEFGRQTQVLEPAVRYTSS